MYKTPPNVRAVSVNDIAARRRQIRRHIKLLKSRYPEPVWHEVVEALEDRLKVLEAE